MGFFQGSNELGIREKTLIEAYESLGRPDLADCIRHGKKYQRLQLLRFGHGGASWQQMVATRRAFLGLPDDAPGMPATEEEWRAMVIGKHPDDEDLHRLVEEEKATAFSKGGHLG